MFLKPTKWSGFLYIYSYESDLSIIVDAKHKKRFLQNFLIVSRCLLRLQESLSLERFFARINGTVVPECF